MALLALMELVQIKLDETLREQLGGTYSPSAGGTPDRIPRQEYTINISYGSSPENVDKLSKSVFALIDSLKTMPPSQANVDKVKEQILREREVTIKQNSYWLGSIRTRDQAGEDVAGLLEPYNALVRALTPQSFQDAAKKYFNTQNYVKIVLLPEKMILGTGRNLPGDPRSWGAGGTEAIRVVPPHVLECAKCLDGRKRYSLSVACFWWSSSASALPATAGTHGTARR